MIAACLTVHAFLQRGSCLDLELGEQLRMDNSGWSSTAESVHSLEVSAKDVQEAKEIKFPNGETMKL